MNDFQIGGVLGGLIVAVALVFSYAATDGDRKSLKNECEKDLARNLKCEMVYVKPSIEGE